MGATLWLALGLLAPARMDLDHPSALEAWSFSNGPEFPGARGTLRHVADLGHESSGAAGLDFDFTNGGNYVQASFALTDERVVAVRLLLKKTTPNDIAFRVVDSGGQTFQKDLSYDFPLYQALHVAFDSWTDHFGGTNDGRFQWPAQRFAILVNRADEAPAGTLLIDEIELITAEAPPPPSQRFDTYNACLFTSAEGWSCGGHPDNRFLSGRWDYRFDDNHTRATLHKELSFQGAPRALRLHIDDDGSGHEVSMTLASHFQSFHRVIATLDQRGSRIIDVPLGDMTTWQHRGGEDDGVVRYPLRLVNIAVDKKGDGSSGRLRLHGLEIETELTSSSPFILLPRIDHLRRGTELTLRVTNMRNEDAHGTLVAQLAGFRSLPAIRRERFWIQAGSVNRELRFRMPHLREPMREARFSLQLDTGPPITVSTTETDLPEPVGSDDLRPASPIGVGLYLYRYGGPNARRNMQKAAALARRAGVKWSREEFQWGRIEPEKGTYTFEFYDQLVEIAHQNGISIYGLLAYWAPWTEPYTSQGVEDYVRWAAAVVRRYKGKIEHWEVYNEPNIFFWKGPRELYADLLSKTYDAIKRENPDARVLGCSTAGIDEEFIKQTMQRGGKFDILTVHPYRPELDEDSFIRELRQVRKLVEDRPVWITEMGWPSTLGAAISERDQACLLARTYVTALASGAVENISWYDFREDGTDPFYHEAHFGIVRRNLAPKPAYRALSTLARHVGDIRFDAAVDLDPDVKAYRFVGRARSVVVLWTKAYRTLALQADGDLELYDLMGQRISAPEANTTIHLAEPIDTPVFLVADKPLRIKRLPLSTDMTIEPEIAGGTTELTIRLPDGYTLGQWELPAWMPAPQPDNGGVWKLDLPATTPFGRHPIAAHVRGPSGTTIKLQTSAWLGPAVIYP